MCLFFAVNLRTFWLYINPIRLSTGMQSVMQSTHIEHESLKEFSYIYLANVAKAMNSAFASYLPTLVPHLLDVINESELSALQEEDEEEEEEEGSLSCEANIYSSVYSCLNIQ